MQYGINLLLWADTLSDSLRPLLDEIKAIGYDAVELPVFEFDVPKYTAWGRYLKEAGLVGSTVTVRGESDNPISRDRSIRLRGIENNKRAVECTQAAGCRRMVGPMHSALGVFSGAGPTEEEWKLGVESMQQVSEYAAGCGIYLAVEPLNRFECYFLNTAADTARFCRAVNHSHCQSMLDTFHAHIEEKNVREAVLSMKGLLGHVHISENDRSTPGSGNVRWEETFQALQEIGYDDLLVIESFGLLLEKLVPTVRIWRRMYRSERQLASDGLQFMQSKVRSYYRSRIPRAQEVQ